MTHVVPDSEMQIYSPGEVIPDFAAQYKQRGLARRGLDHLARFAQSPGANMFFTSHAQMQHELQIGFKKAVAGSVVLYKKSTAIAHTTHVSVRQTAPVVKKELRRAALIVAGVHLAVINDPHGPAVRSLIRAALDEADAVVRAKRKVALKNIKASREKAKLARKQKSYAAKKFG